MGKVWCIGYSWPLRELPLLLPLVIAQANRSSERGKISWLTIATVWSSRLPR